MSQKEVNIKEIQIGDILLVRPGDKIPVDGEVIGGHSYVDESMINGEPIPKAKRDGEEVFAGTINQDGVLHIKAKKIGSKTVLSNIIRLVEKAQSSRPPVQKLAKIDVAAFDKTGTITEGQPEVDDVICYGISENELVELAASVEKNSNHPIAKAIVRKASDMNLELIQTSSFENITGKGLKAQVNDKDILAGNKKLLESQDIEIPQSVLEEYGRLEDLSKTIILIGVDGEIKGILSLSDKIKANSKRTIEELHKMGIETYMLTGDNKKTASTVASAVGIDNVCAGVLPENKLDIVKNLQKEDKTVLFVGDGINDAPALTQANIGVAMGNGTDIAMESGDIVVMEGDLENVVAAVQFSKKVMTRIKENLFWAFAYNVILIPLAAGALYAGFGIMFMPEWSALAMALSSVTVISLSLALKGYVPAIKKETKS